MYMLQYVWVLTELVLYVSKLLCAVQINLHICMLSVGAAA